MLTVCTSCPREQTEEHRPTEQDHQASANVCADDSGGHRAPAESDDEPRRGHGPDRAEPTPIPWIAASMDDQEENGCCDHRDRGDAGCPLGAC